ncbi:MAG: ABC transporter permease [Planctomycetaceae bacterium]|jgi:hypothetical protein|nr:ABC transporter permease [Planctomycetaceae bacterium]
MSLKLFSVNINPLLLRELRQQVRNRFVIVLINLYLAVLVLVCAMCVFEYHYSSQRHGVGEILFGSLATVMGIACFLTVVVYTALTTASERINNDLMFTSALKPSSIVFGKALAGAILTVLLMSMTAPFVMVAYLLRGLDIEVVAITFISIFTAIQVFNSMAICVCSNVKTKIQMLTVLGGCFFVSIFGLQMIFTLVFSHYRFFTFGTLTWFEFLIPFLIAGAVFAVFLTSAIATIAPPASNRLLPLRLTVTIIYLGSLLICLNIPSGDMSWIYSWTIALAVLMFMVVSERETWSPRIRRTLPKSFIFRAILFPFYTGSANGFVWLTLLGLGVYFVLLHAIIKSGTNPEILPFYWFLFSFDYCVTAMLLRSRFLSKKIMPEKTSVIVLLLFFVFVPGGMLTCFLLQNSEYSDFYDVYSQSFFSVLNPFMMNEFGSGGGVERQGVTALIWFLGLLIPFFIWFISCVRHFSPKNIEETLTLEQAIAAIREAETNPLVQSDRERAKKNNVTQTVSLSSP